MMYNVVNCQILPNKNSATAQDNIKEAEKFPQKKAQNNLKKVGLCHLGRFYVGEGFFVLVCKT